MASQNNSETNSLESFVEKVNGESHLRIETDFGDGFVRLRTSEAERRQAAQDIRCSEDVVVELLRNARDAGAKLIFVASSCENKIRSLVVIDDGSGIPEKMHEKIFEPRVTSKLDTSHMDKWGLHGRGMALFSIAQNSELARVVDSAPGKGSALCIQTNLTKLSEKADQSTFPTFRMEETGTVVVRGPKNIVRTTCEFAIEEHDECEVFFGSPSEIVAALYEYGMSSLTTIERAFTKNSDDLVITKRLALAADPKDLSDMASKMGLVISERTARRIMNGAIAPVDCILNLVNIEKPGTSPVHKRSHIHKAASKTTRISAQDQDTIKNAAFDAFTRIAPQYYLSTDVEAKTSVKSGTFTISIPIIED